MKTYKGIWCCGSKEPVNGILTISDDNRITLDLFCNIFNIDRIVGVSEDKCITLTGCRCAKFGSGGVVYEVDFAYISDRFEIHDDLKFEKIKLGLSGLHSWLWNHSFKIDRNDKEKQITVKYMLPKVIMKKWNDDYDISFLPTANMSPLSVSQKEMSINEDVTLSFESKEPKPLKDLLREVYIFECFLNLASGVRQSRSDIKVYNSQTGWISVYFRQNNPKDIKKIYPPQMPFCYRYIADKFEEFVLNWRNIYQQYMGIFDLYFSTENSTQNYVEPTFLAYAQVLEAFHRRKTESNRKEVRDNIRDMISKCPEEYQDFLNEKLCHAHELSFMDRMKDLCSECSVMSNILNLTFEIDEDSFLKKVRDNRNYLTHYDKKLENKKSDFLELFYISEKLKIMIHYFRLSTKRNISSEIFRFFCVYF